MKKIYAIFLADSLGNFDWVLVFPKPYYLTREEAESARQELIRTEPTITLENSKIVKEYVIEVKKNENLKNDNQLN